MKVKEINKDIFNEEVLNSKGVVLVDFYANWCGPCKMLRPVLENIAEERNDVKIVSINVDEAEELSMSYGISSIPCVVKCHYRLNMKMLSLKMELKVIEVLGLNQKKN